MKNLSILTIPIATPPETPPPAGQVYVFFDTEDQLQVMGDNGMVEPLHLRKHTAQITLTEEFAISGVPAEGSNKLILTGDLTDKIKSRSVVLVEDASIEAKDSIMIVRNVELNADGNTELTIRRRSFPSSIAESGKLHIAKNVNIEHLLGSKAVTFSLRSVATGESVDASDKVVDEDNLILMPNTPSLGEYLVTIVA